MNAALTIGTLDGANVEIRQQVGTENVCRLGLADAEVRRVLCCEHWPQRHVEENSDERQTLEWLDFGVPGRGDRGVLQLPVGNLLHSDRYLVRVDCTACVDCQEHVSEAWRNVDHGSRMSTFNTARSSPFSSDRAIQECCDDTWHVPAVRMQLD